MGTEADEVTVEGDEEVTVEIEEAPTVVVVDAEAPSTDAPVVEAALDHEQRLTRLEGTVADLISNQVVLADEVAMQAVENEVQDAVIAEVIEEVTEPDPEPTPDEAPESKRHRWWGK